MPRSILYLGLDPERWPSQDKIIHYPVIRTEGIDSEAFRETLTLWPQFTHVIFTSRRAVFHWWEVQPCFGNRIAIAIGEGTRAELRDRGVVPIIAPEATQEGVMALLDQMALGNAYLLLPCSKRARGDLAQHLAKKGVRLSRVDLYDTLFQRPEPVYPLDRIDEIVFTSPSTVEGFLRIYGVLPKGKRLTAIGPVTQKALAVAIQ